MSDKKSSESGNSHIACNTKPDEHNPTKESLLQKVSGYFERKATKFKMADDESPTGYIEFCFPPEHQTNLSDKDGIQSTVWITTHYPTKKNSPLDEKVLEISIMLTSERRNQTPAYFMEKELTEEQKILISKNTNPTSTNRISLNHRDGIIGILTNQKGYLVFFEDPGELSDTYTAYGNLSESIEIRYKYNKHLRVNFSEIDAFCINFLNTHIYPPSSDREQI